MSIYPPYSYWENDIWLKKADIAIIGGGIVGLSAALHVKSGCPALDVLILERSIVGTAASTRNAGFACFGSPTELLDDLESRSDDEVFGLVDRRIKGLNLLRSVIGDDQMRYKQYGGYEVFLDDAKLEQVYDKLDLINSGLSQIDPGLKYFEVANDLFHGAKGVLKNNWEGQLHPGAMYRALEVQCISQGVRILRGVEVQKVYPDNSIIAEKVTFKADKTIITTNAFASHLAEEIQTAPARNMVLITRPIENLQVQGCYHYDKGYVYFRNVDDRLLIGGGRNIDQEGETTHTFGVNDKIKNYLERLLSDHILYERDFEIERSWSGIMGVNDSKDPIIKSIGLNQYVAVGLGGMGVAIGMLAGREVADLLLQS